MWSSHYCEQKFLPISVKKIVSYQAAMSLMCFCHLNIFVAKKSALALIARIFPSLIWESHPYILLFLLLRNVSSIRIGNEVNWVAFQSVVHSNFCYRVATSNRSRSHRNILLERHKNDRFDMSNYAGWRRESCLSHRRNSARLRRTELGKEQEYSRCVEFSWRFNSFFLFFVWFCAKFGLFVKEVFVEIKGAGCCSWMHRGRRHIESESFLADRVRILDGSDGEKKSLHGIFLHANLKNFPFFRR